MLNTAQRIETILRKIDPKFAAAHSQVHIESTSIAAARSAKAMQTILPGPVMGLQMLFDVALGSEERSRFYYDEFRKRSSKRGV